MPLEEWAVTSLGGEIQCLHNTATTTKGREIIIPKNVETSLKEIRVLMCLLGRRILWERIGIMVLHRVDLMGKEQVDIKAKEQRELISREQVLAMGRVTQGLEKVKGSHKVNRGTGKESKGPMHQWDKREVTK